MVQKQVVVNNGIYECDIDVSVEEWKKILEDKDIIENNYIDMLIKFYNELEHKSTCKAIGEKYKISPQSPNAIITNFAKAAQKILNRFEVISTEGKPTYWIIPMTGKYLDNNNFEWTMRPELAQAIAKKGVENREDVKENLIQLFSYIRSKNDDEIKFAKDLIRNGSNFAIEFIKDEYLLGPSKFIGYIKNSYKIHTQYKRNRHGSFTDNKLERIYNTINKGSDTHSLYLNMIKNICNKYNIERNFDSINNIYIPESELDNNNKINRNNNMTDINTIINLLQTKKQIILQGAPGTGKTYSTVEIAVALCKGVDNIPNNRIELMEVYNKLVKKERIAFTTFHQSMDYEEFVEGLKPVKDSNPMRFEPKAGIFKQMCEKSILSTIIINNKITKELEFDYIYDNLVEKIEDDEKQNLTTKTGSIINLSVSSEKNIVFTHNNSVKKYTVSKKRLGELYKEFDSIEKLEAINNMNDEIRNVIGGCNASGYWTVLKYILENGTIEEDNETQIEDLEYKNQSNLIQNVLNTPKQERELIKDNKPYVLIIDEINRGNISKILGELITLLEADKRIGEENELQATLPYSNEKFAVPSNLYIIGTMNTADRSLGYIDYAIRRRFAFYTLKAEKSVIEKYYQDNEALKNEAINLFDEVQKLILKNIASEFNVEDLMIGHSYFLVEGDEELDLKLEYEIKPLLREYAFDGILDKLKKVGGVYQEIENLGKVSNIIDNYQDDSENGED